MPDCRSYEEHFYGIERNREGSGIERIDEALAKARQYGVEKGGVKIEEIVIEARFTPLGAGSVNYDDTFRFPIGGTGEQAAIAMIARFRGSPGPAWAGNLRLNFYIKQPFDQYITSYSRNIRPGEMSSETEAVVSLQARFDGYVNRLEAAIVSRDAMLIRALDANVANTVATANVCKAWVEMVRPGATGAPAQGGSSLPMLLQILGGAVKAAGEGGNPTTGALTEAAKGVATAATTPGTDGTPPVAPAASGPIETPPPSSGPAPAAGMSEADFDRFAAENPELVKRKLVEKLRAKGAPDMMIQLVETG